MTEFITEHGDKTAPEREILRCTVGSEVHGIGIPGTDDHDKMGIYVETPEQVMGIGFAKQHYVARTVPEGHRSRHGDTDLVMYSLRKYMALVATGNPTALLPLFAPQEFVLKSTPLGAYLRILGPSLLSQQAVHRFLGYADSQRQRVAGQDTRHTPNRPELVEKYGYDTKYASHALRLVIQGLEVARYGRLTLPLREDERDLCLGVKQGARPLEQVLDMIDGRATLIRVCLENGTCPLPEKPDIELVNRWLASAHQHYWAGRTH